MLARKEESELKSKLYTPRGSFMVSKEVNVCPAICSYMLSYFSHAEKTKRVEQMAMTDEDSSQHFSSGRRAI